MPFYFQMAQTHHKEKDLPDEFSGHPIAGKLTHALLKQWDYIVMK